MVRSVEREAGAMPLRLHLHGESGTDGPTVKEWANTVAIVVLAGVVALIALWFNAQLTAQRAANAHQSALFEVFLKSFAAENNYECRTDEYLAQVNHLPLPTSGTCAVVAP